MIHNDHVLARMADTYSPDRPDSPGAEFLLNVQSATREALDWQTEQEGQSLAEAIEHVRDERTNELADGAVPVYTFARWATFIDLGAWQADISDYANGDQDMTRLCGLSLYLIAETLVGALLDDEDWTGASELDGPDEYAACECGHDDCGAC